MSDRYVVLTIEPGKSKRLPRPGRVRTWRRRLAAVIAVLALVTAGSVGLLIFGAEGGVPAEPPPGFDLNPAALPSASSSPEADPSAIVAAPPTADPADPVDSPDASEPVPIPVLSGSLADLPLEERGRAPVRVIVEVLDIDAHVGAVGVADGEMEIPRSAEEVAWYRYGPEPGGPGSSVLAAHVDWDGRPGVFNRLRDLPPRASIEVVFDDGSRREFRTVGLTSYAKTELPIDRIFAREGSPVLTLITCGGAFNPSLRAYEDNVVVYALPVDSIEASPGGVAGGDEPRGNLSR